MVRTQKLLMFVLSAFLGIFLYATSAPVVTGLTVAGGVVFLSASDAEAWTRRPRERRGHRRPHVVDVGGAGNSGGGVCFVHTRTGATICRSRR